METAKENHKAALKTYKKLKKDAHNIRRNFLNDRINSATSEKAKKEYTQILMHEESRRCWRAINNSRGKKPQSGISAVTVKENDVWKHIDTKLEVEEAIMSNNSARFHLTGDTPLMQPDAVENLDISQRPRLRIPLWRVNSHRMINLTIPLIISFNLFHNVKRFLLFQHR